MDETGDHPPRTYPLHKVERPGKGRVGHSRVEVVVQYQCLSVLHDYLKRTTKFDHSGTNRTFLTCTLSIPLVLNERFLEGVYPTRLPEKTVEEEEPFPKDLSTTTSSRDHVHRRPRPPATTSTLDHVHPRPRPPPTTSTWTVNPDPQSVSVRSPFPSSTGPTPEPRG